MFSLPMHSALRAVVSSLWENNVPVQAVIDAIGSAVEVVEIEAINRYAERVRTTGRRFKGEVLGQGFLPGIDDRPEIHGKRRRIVRTASIFPGRNDPGWRDAEGNTSNGPEGWPIGD